MKSEKGITLAALVVYLVVVTGTLVLLGTLTTKMYQILEI